MKSYRVSLETDILGAVCHLTGECAGEMQGLEKYVGMGGSQVGVTWAAMDDPQCLALSTSGSYRPRVQLCHLPPLPPAG